MNKKYERYIEYIVNDMEPPYFINMINNYGSSPDEYELVLSKIFNQPVTIKYNYVYNNRGNLIYIENSDGYWIKYDYDDDGNQIYYENSDGIWYKQEYDNDGNKLYYKDSSGYIIDYR